MVVLLVLGISGFGQDAAVISGQSTRSHPANTPRRGDRVFYFKNSAGSVTGETVIPFQLSPYQLRRGDRVFYFKDGTGNVTGEAGVPFQLSPYQLSHRDRVFYFKNSAGSVPEKDSQGAADKK